MESLQDAVLMDNTTIFGAKYAYDFWPPRKEDWFDGPNSVNIRSLMDLLEALVLYDTLVVDSSSASPKTERVIWDDLQSLREFPNNKVKRIFIQEPLVRGGEFVELAVGAALEKLRVYLRDGVFLKGLANFQQSNSSVVVPSFFTSPTQFADLLAESFQYAFSEELVQQLAEIKNDLRRANQTVSNYAMFAFRGFYYQQIAHLYSISYTPHTWRSDLVEFDINNRGINFAEHISGKMQGIRKDLAKKLNLEFGVTGFSSDFPVFASYIAHQCNSRSQLLRTALEIRKSSSAKNFRNWIHETQKHINNQADLPKIFRAQEELESIVVDIRKEFGLSDKAKTEQIKIKLGVPVISAEIEAPVTFPASMPSWLGEIFHRRTHLVFLRSVMESSANLSPFAIRFQQLKP